MRIVTCPAAASVRVPVTLLGDQSSVSVVMAMDQFWLLSFVIWRIVPVGKGTEPFAGIVIVWAAVVPEI